MEYSRLRQQTVCPEIVQWSLAVMVHHCQWSTNSVNPPVHVYGLDSFCLPTCISIIYYDSVLIRVLHCLLDQFVAF